MALVSACCEVDGPDTVVVCEAYAARCWALAPGWDAWALHYPESHLAALEDAGTITEMFPAPAGDRCWRARPTDLPLCEVEIDGALVHGIPVEISRDLFDIEFTPANCAGLGPWVAVHNVHGDCYGQIDGVAVLLDMSRPVPASLAL